MKRNKTIILYALVIAIIACLNMQAILSQDMCAEFSSIGDCFQHISECRWMNGACQARNPDLVQQKPAVESTSTASTSTSTTAAASVACGDITSQGKCLISQCVWDAELKECSGKVTEESIVKTQVVKKTEVNPEPKTLEESKKLPKVQETEITIKLSKENVLPTKTTTSSENKRGGGKQRDPVEETSDIREKKGLTQIDGITFSTEVKRGDSHSPGNGIANNLNEFDNGAYEDPTSVSTSVYTKPLGCSSLGKLACKTQDGCVLVDNQCVDQINEACAVHDNYLDCKNAGGCIFVDDFCVSENFLPALEVDCTQYKSPMECKQNWWQCEWKDVSIDLTESPTDDSTHSSSSQRQKSSKNVLSNFKLVDGACINKDSSICRKYDEEECEANSSMCYWSTDGDREKCKYKSEDAILEYVSQNQDWGLKRFQKLTCASFKKNLCLQNFYMCVWNPRTYTCHDRTSQAAVNAVECTTYSMQKCLSYNKDCVWDYKSLTCNDGFEFYSDSCKDDFNFGCAEYGSADSCNFDSFVCRWDPNLNYCFPRTPVDGTIRNQRTLSAHIFPYPCRPKAKMELYLEGANCEGSIFTQMDYYREYDNLFRSRASKFFLGRFGLDFTVEDYFQGAMLIPFKLRDELFAQILDSYIDAPHMDIPKRNRVLIDGYRVLSAPRSVPVISGSYAEYMGKKSMVLDYEDSLLYIELRIVDEFGQVYHQLEVTYPYPVHRDDDLSVVTAIGDVFHTELGRGVLRQVEFTEPDNYLKKYNSRYGGSYHGYDIGYQSNVKHIINNFKKKGYKQISRIQTLAIITFQECDFINPGYATVPIPVGSATGVAYGLGPANGLGPASPLIAGGAVQAGGVAVGGVAAPAGGVIAGGVVPAIGGPVAQGAGFIKTTPITYTPDYTVSQSRSVLREYPTTYIPGLGVRTEDWATGVGLAQTHLFPNYPEAPPLTTVNLPPVPAPQPAPLYTQPPPIPQQSYMPQQPIPQQPIPQQPIQQQPVQKSTSYGGAAQVASSYGAPTGQVAAQAYGTSGQSFSTGQYNTAQSNVAYNTGVQSNMGYNMNQQQGASMQGYNPAQSGAYTMSG